MRKRKEKKKGRKSVILQTRLTRERRRDRGLICPGEEIPLSQLCKRISICISQQETRRVLSTRVLLLNERFLAVLPSSPYSFDNLLPLGRITTRYICIYASTGLSRRDGRAISNRFRFCNIEAISFVLTKLLFGNCTFTIVNFRYIYQM